jgi:ankyrin repeat protein
LVARVLSLTNARGETPVHTLAWKAPTELVLQALNIRGVSPYLTMCDRDLNTPLHLACANVTNRSEFAVIRNMANLAPQALAFQNEHGDTRTYAILVMV